MKIPELAHALEKYSGGGEQKKVGNEEMQGDPKAIRKCPLHPKLDAYLFCAQCCEVICENCKSTIHSEHVDKGVIFEYLDFVNLARSRVHIYKDKFLKYLEDAKVPIKEHYDSYM